MNGDPSAVKILSWSEVALREKRSFLVLILSRVTSLDFFEVLMSKKITSQDIVTT